MGDGRTSLRIHLHDKHGLSGEVLRGSLDVFDLHTEDHVSRPGFESDPGHTTSTEHLHPWGLLGDGRTEDE